MSIGVGRDRPIADNKYAIVSYRPITPICDKPIATGGPSYHSRHLMYTLFNTNWYLNPGNRCNPGAQEIPPHIKTH